METYVFPWLCRCSSLDTGNCGLREEAESLARALQERASLEEQEVGKRLDSKRLDIDRKRPGSRVTLVLSCRGRTSASGNCWRTTSSRWRNTRH